MSEPLPDDRGSRSHQNAGVCREIYTIHSWRPVQEPVTFIDQLVPTAGKTFLDLLLHFVVINAIRQRATDLGLTLDADMQTLADDGSPQIARPEHWGGFRLWATMIELWIEGKNRIHDRASWRRDIVRATEHTFSTSPWTGTRLQP